MLLFPMEGNALKTHRQFPASDSRQLRDAIALVLFDIKERCTGEKRIRRSSGMKIMSD